ncbi:MAG TPA: serine/threonine-protein kinase [Polyangiaceae bacterium]|nr:serine/threonine-protein kinase [Polyangiaceae bacterium]
MQLAADVVIAERFRLTRQLGQGGMGSVWLATHLALDIPCAVKFIEGEIAQLPEAQARFEREAKAAAQLRSPHVVQILDHGVFQGTPYIAMELLDGEDFGKRLQRIGRMPPNDVLRIIGQVCRALTKAHGVGIVHRDLKPENIFLVPDDDREIAKVLDFGIAKATGAGGIDGSNTKTGAMLGTPYYMSPEQAQGIKAVDARSDLWSLAVIVFQALTGRLPFESEALGDLLVRIIVAPVPMPSHFVSDLPQSFDRWWEKASQRDPALRFQSAREFGDSLAVAFGHSKGLSGEGMMARPGDPGTGPYPAAGPLPFGSTPQPLNHAFGHTPNPVFGHTPQPPYGGTQPLQAMGPTTGASMSRTYDAPPSARPKSKATAMIIGGASVVVLALVILGATFALKGKEAPVAPTAAASAPTPPAAPPPQPVATAAPSPVVPPAPPPAVVAVETPPAATVAPTVTATPAATQSVKPAHAFSPPSHPAAPPPPAPTANKKVKVDLGI